MFGQSSGNRALFIWKRIPFGDHTCFYFPNTGRQRQVTARLHNISEKATRRFQIPRARARESIVAPDESTTRHQQAQHPAPRCRPHPSASTDSSVSNSPCPRRFSSGAYPSRIPPSVFCYRPYQRILMQFAPRMSTEQPHAQIPFKILHVVSQKWNSARIEKRRRVPVGWSGPAAGYWPVRSRRTPWVW